MALNEKVWLTIPIELIKTAGTSSDIVIIIGSGVPDGNTAPQSDAAKGSIYIQDDATDDESFFWLKVDADGADDDWVRVFMDKSENAYTLENTLTMDADHKIYLRGTDNFIHSNAGSEISLTAAGCVTINKLVVDDAGTKMSSILCGSATHVFGALAQGGTSSESSPVTGLTQEHKVFLSPSSISGSLAITEISCSPGGDVMVCGVANSGSEAFAGGNVVFGWMAVAACGA